MGNTAADSYDEQIAALESALTLPLPDSTRAQIEQDLGVLRAQRAAQLASSAGAKIEGTTNVRGTLHGNAIGVNLGTVQTFLESTKKPCMIYHHRSHHFSLHKILLANAPIGSPLMTFGP